MNIILEFIENFFILWFVVTMCKEKISTNKIKFFIMLVLVTVFAVCIQQILFFNSEIINMLFNMAIGIAMYAYVLKLFYCNLNSIFKIVLYVIIYFICFIIIGEQIFALLVSPVLNFYSMSEPTIIKICVSIPYRMFEVFIILVIGKINGGKTNVKTS